MSESTTQQQQQQQNDIYDNNNNNNITTTTTSFESHSIVTRRQHALQTGPLRPPPPSSPSPSLPLPLIDVTLCHGGLFLVWRPDDVFLLRSHFRLVGALVGALPFAVQQNDTASLPLVLSYEELALLHRLAVVRLVPLRALPPAASPEQRAQRLTAAQTLDRIRASVTLVHRRVLELKHRAAAAAKKRKESAPVEADGGAFTASLADVDDLDAKLAASALAVEQLFAAYAAAAPINGVADDAAVDAADASCALPPMPVSTSAAHCAVFADLWQRGFFLTSASKFGGDFLAYMGDPLKFHAAYVVVVARSAEPLLLCEIAALGRLANAVKKTGVVASLDVRCACGASTVCRHDIANDEHAALTVDEFAARHHATSEVRYLTIDWRSMTK